MNREAALREDGKVFAFWDIEGQQTYLHPHYQFSCPPTASISDTGLIVIFTLTSISGSEPSFVGRWDDGSRKSRQPKASCDLDTEIEGVPEEEKQRFKRGKNGCAGHRWERVPSDGGFKYRGFIQTPTAGKIFEGQVWLKAGLRKLAISETFSAAGGKLQLS